MSGNESSTTMRSDLPSSFVIPKVVSLQKQFLEGSPDARAVLAQLRAATTGDPGAAWGISEYLLPERELKPNMLRSGYRYADSADFAETAIHIAMTSYASMQQARSEPMHVDKRSLGTASRLLGGSADEPMDQGKVWQRLSKLAQAQSVSGLRWQLRGMISLLKRRGIGMDFGQLANDLYFWQMPERRVGVQRTWSRAFFNTAAGATPDVGRQGATAKGPGEQQGGQADADDS
ncbi:type I-E CRISPR-associated protein Cse2/CasB [Brevibacterium casei]